MSNDDQSKLYFTSPSSRAAMKVLLVVALGILALVIIPMFLPSRKHTNREPEPPLLNDARALANDFPMDFYDEVVNGRDTMPVFDFIHTCQKHDAQDLIEPIKQGEVWVYYSTRHEDWFDDESEPIVVMNMMVYLRDTEHMVYMGYKTLPTRMEEGLFLMLMDRLGWTRYEPTDVSTQPATRSDQSE